MISSRAQQRKRRSNRGNGIRLSIDNLPLKHPYILLLLLLLRHLDSEEAVDILTIVDDIVKLLENRPPGTQ